MRRWDLYSQKLFQDDTILLYLTIISPTQRSTEKGKTNKVYWYLEACLCIEIAHGMIARATAVVIITTGGRVERTTASCIAVVPKVIYAAAGVALRARIVVIANGRRLHRWWGRRPKVWRVGTLLYRIRGLHCYTTHTHRKWYASMATIDL